MRLELHNNVCFVSGSKAEIAWLHGTPERQGYLVFKFTKGTGANVSTERRTVLRQAEDGRHYFPAGLAQRVKRAAEQPDTGKPAFEVVFVDKREPPCDPDFDADLGWLMPHQREAIDLVAKHTRGIIQHATSGGKGDTIIGLAKFIPCRWLFGAYSFHLVADEAKRWAKDGDGSRPGVVGDGNFDLGDERFVCATWQTLAARVKRGCEKTIRYLASVQGVVAEECFPVGTLVGGTPIEDVRVGDLVPAFDERSNTIVARRVTRLFKSTPRRLVTITVAGRRPVCCTPGHPFFTRDGWKRAEALNNSDSVLVVKHGQDSSRTVQSVRNKSTVLRDSRPGTRAERLRLLLGTVPCDVDGRVQKSERSSTGIATGQSATDARQKSDAHPGGARSDGCHATPHQTCPSCLGRQRSTVARAATSAGRTAELAGGAPCRLPQRSTRSGVSVALHNRCCERRVEDRDRGGREVAQIRSSQDQGSEEGRVFEWARVDRVEVLEPTSDGTFGGMCSDGYVYNLEVEELHTYVADGFVVHNCHTGACSTVMELAAYMPNAYWWVGVSGTPLDRTDKMSVLVVCLIGDIIHKVSAQQLVEMGWSAEAQVKILRVEQNSVVGDWKRKHRHLIIESIVRNEAVVRLVQMAERPAMVFFQEIAHGKHLAKMCAKAGVRCDLSYGTDRTEMRRNKLRWLVREGDAVLFVNKTFQEGEVDKSIADVRSIINVAGGRSKIRVIQQLGRGMRKRRADGSIAKETFDVYDIEDVLTDIDQSNPPSLVVHSRERIKAYKRAGHKITYIE